MMKSRNIDYFAVVLICLGLSGCAWQTTTAEHAALLAEGESVHDAAEVLPVEPLAWTREEVSSDAALPSVKAGPEGAVGAEAVSDKAAASTPEPTADTPLTAGQLAQKEVYHPLVSQVSDEFGLDVDLLHAMIRVESNYQPQAISPKGARGLMQVMPATGERFGFKDLMDPHHNLRAGASYMQWLINHFNNDLTLALAAYNAGEGAVKRHGHQIPPYPETKHYVQKVLTHYQPSASRQQTPVNAVARLPEAAPAADTLAENKVEPMSGKEFAAKLLGLFISSPDSAHQLPAESADNHSVL